MTRAIAIDGPAGAGKSTIAKRTAERLGFTYVDTGALYRALAVFFLQKGLKPEDEEAIAASCAEASVDITYRDGVQQVWLNGENVTGKLRTEEVGKMASVSSALPEVRQHLLALQQSLAKRYDVIMDGRDIGTTILPDADLKIFLTADVSERARRRIEQLRMSGLPYDSEKIEKEIRERDERDMNRRESPLRQAEDAILIDSSKMTVEEVADRILELFETREDKGES